MLSSIPAMNTAIHLRRSALAPVSLLALAAALAVGCAVPAEKGPGSSGGSSGGASSSGGGAGVGTGNVDGSVVGIWQETVSSGGDFENTLTGATFTVTQGYSAKLKIRADGSYSFEHYSAGASSSCSSVTAFDKSRGVADFDGKKLVLKPSQRTVDVTGCGDSGVRTLGSDPIVFDARITAYETIAKERTLAVELTNGPYPLKLKLLQLDPASQKKQPAQPADFTLGKTGPFTELLGTWAPSAGSDLRFYDPKTGAAYMPKYNGAEHKWLVFTEDGYEMASALENAAGVGSGVCKKDVVYWEKGAATFAVVQRVNDDYSGDVRFTASEARLVVTIRDCEEDDGTTTYTLAPLTSYWKWRWSAAVGINLGAEYERTPFQWAMATNSVGWDTYRKR